MESKIPEPLSGPGIQLVKKVHTDFFDCASPAKHFAFAKMLLRPKSLEKMAFRWRVIETRGGPCPLALPCVSIICRVKPHFLTVKNSGAAQRPRN